MYNYADILNEMVKQGDEYFEDFATDWQMIQFYMVVEAEMSNNRSFTARCTSRPLKTILRDEYSVVHTIWMRFDKELRRRGIKQ